VPKKPSEEWGEDGSNGKNSGKSGVCFFSARYGARRGSDLALPRDPSFAVSEKIHFCGTETDELSLYECLERKLGELGEPCKQSVLKAIQPEGRVGTSARPAARRSPRSARGAPGLAF